jgi:hypothetical protein
MQDTKQTKCLTELDRFVIESYLSTSPAYPLSRIARDAGVTLGQARRIIDENRSTPMFIALAKTSPRVSKR